MRVAGNLRQLCAADLAGLEAQLPGLTLTGYTPQQQAAINQYGYLPVGWSGAPIVMPAPAAAPVAAPAPVAVAVRPMTTGPASQPQVISPFTSAPAVIADTGVATSETVSDLYKGSKTAATAGGGLGILGILAAVYFGSQ